MQVYFMGPAADFIAPFLASHPCALGSNAAFTEAEIGNF